MTLHIPLLIGQNRFVITVQEDGSLYCATGSDFLNIVESNAGFGVNIEQAITALLKSYGMPRNAMSAFMFAQVEKTTNNPNL